MENSELNLNNNIIYGRNSVLEAIRSGREIDRLFVAHGVTGGSVAAIIAKCSAKGILIKEISPQKLDYYCGGANHQGVAVMFASQEYATVEDILNDEKTLELIAGNHAAVENKSTTVYLYTPLISYTPH